MCNAAARGTSWGFATNHKRVLTSEGGRRADLEIRNISAWRRLNLLSVINYYNLFVYLAPRFSCMLASCRFRGLALIGHYTHRERRPGGKKINHSELVHIFEDSHVRDDEYHDPPPRPP